MGGYGASCYWNQRFHEGLTIVSQKGYPESRLNIVPIDKLWPGNILYNAKFFFYVKTIDPHRLIFRDGKSFKADEGILKIGRSDPLTGEKPTQIVSSNFRNRYCIMGMTSINRVKGKAVVYTIGKIVQFYYYKKHLSHLLCF